MADVIRCADGLVNDPGRFLNFTDRNCIPYTPLELFLFAGGCLMWVAAYWLIIRNARRDKLVDMAVAAGCSNFAWEFLWSFPFRTDMGWFLVWTYRAWFFLDIYIFWLMLRYGSSQAKSPVLARHFKPLTVGLLAVFTLIYYFFIKEGHDTLIGANSAYIAQMFVSVLSLTLLLGNPGLRGFSFNVGWLRTFGTGANTVFMFMHYPGNHFLHSMAASSFVIDIAFLAIFLRFKSRSSGPAPGAGENTAGRGEKISAPA
ncbi:MAG: hypothetical protein JWP91_2016 [Fibrobacteres bacterium]|nr:hypothetical protein [Fibrobacterota bacterium]